MKQNNLTGTIPSFIGGLTNLQVLDFDFNQLQGTIPSVSLLSILILCCVFEVIRRKIVNFLFL
jgi:Leucine-rich repeat (LRR) protein